MPPATEHNKSGAPRVDLRSAIGLLQSYQTAIDGKPDAEKLSLVDYLRQRPDLLDVNELTIGDVDELTGLYRAAAQQYDSYLGQAYDEAPLGAIHKAQKKTDAGGRLSPEAELRRPYTQQASSVGFRAKPSSSLHDRKNEIEVPDEWAQGFSQVIQDSVIVDQLPGDLTDDPAEDPNAQFSVGRSSAKRPQPALDVKFNVLNFATPIAFTIAIKDFRTGRNLLNTWIEHGGLTADEMIEGYHDKCPDGCQLHKRTENGFDLTHTRHAEKTNPAQLQKSFPALLSRRYGFRYRI